MNLQASAERIRPRLVELRRELHQHPELGLAEEWTPNRIRTELDSIGVPHVTVDEGSIVGIVGLRGERNLALRADMDGLPIVEETGLEFASINGCMHACGHDGHVTMLLGAARLLKDVEGELAGAIYLCFQTAEENGYGAKPIVDYLKKQGGVDQVIAIHLWAGVDSGSISIVAGARMAGADYLEITVRGRGGHGSRPDLSIDPIKPACQIALGISSIPTNFVTPLEPAIVHVGSIQAGSAGNVFPGEARILAGVRSFSPESREAIFKALHRIVEHGAAMYGATAEVEIGVGAPPVVNDPAAVDMADKVLAQMDGRLRNVPFERICASENFPVYLDEFGGFMAFLGVRRPDREQFYQHHPRFDIDEDVLPLGTEFFARYAVSFLAGRVD